MNDTYTFPGPEYCEYIVLHIDWQIHSYIRKYIEKHTTQLILSMHNIREYNEKHGT